MSARDGEIEPTDVGTPITVQVALLDMSASQAEARGHDGSSNSMAPAYRRDSPGSQQPRYPALMQQDPSVRNLRIVGLSFIPVVLGGAIAVIALNAGWDDRDATLATIGLWVVIVLGILGPVAAVRWRTGATERTITAGRLTTTYFVTLALTEAPLLAGFVFTVVARDQLPFWIGAASFSASLVVVVTALSLIELQSDGSPTGLIR